MVTAGKGTKVNDHLKLYAQWSTDQSSVPEAPTGIQFSNVGTASVTVSWTAPSPGTLPNGNNDTISKYIVYYSTDTNFTKGAASKQNSNTTSATISLLTPGTTYYFKVSATNNDGEGDLSSKEEQATNSAAEVPGQVGSITVQRKAAGEATVSWTVPTTLGKKPDGTDYIATDISVEIHYKEAADSDFSSSTLAKIVDYDTKSLSTDLDSIPVNTTKGEPYFIFLWRTVIGKKFISSYLFRFC